MGLTHDSLSLKGKMLSKHNCGKKEKATLRGQGLMLIELLVQATKKTRISAADKGNHQGADHSKAGKGVPRRESG